MTLPTDLAPPVRLTLACSECGFTHSALALHEEALGRARRCPECTAPCEVVSVHPVSLGCSCC
jgi:hypothetical protein